MRDRAISRLILLDCMRMLTWDEDNRCRLTVPAHIARSRDFREDRPTMLAVLRRATVFKQQLAVLSGSPFVELRGSSRADRFGGCPSCGGKITTHKQDGGDAGGEGSRVVAMPGAVVDLGATWPVDLGIVNGKRQPVTT